MPLSSGARLGPYEILAAIGAGGMGEVYKARDIRLDRSVAIKVLPAHVSADPDRRARFEREAKTIAGLDHPHICALHDVGEHEGSAFLVMEHLTGETLAERLEKGPLPLDQALTVATEIADALSAAHRQGVIHRDLKPGNVMLTKGGAKLLDFGLAKLKGHGDQPVVAHLESAPTQSTPLTGEGMIVGTLQYMAPEQLEGKPADARTDLWALGAILYEMLTGKRAFEGTSAASLIGAILEREPTPLTALQPLTPPALDRLVRRCLAKQPEERWDTAHDVADELRWTREARGVGIVAGVWPRRRRALWTALVAAGVLALVVTTAVVTWLATRVVTGFRRDNGAPASVPAHLSIELPDGLQLTATPPALSPDGRHLAFSALGRSGIAIYIRDLDSFDVREIPGSAGGAIPFFSPDGQWLGFSTGTLVKKAPVAGGPASTAARTPFWLAKATWMTEGQIVATGLKGGLWGVPSEPRPTAEPVELTRIDQTRGDQFYDRPLALPDGRILFTIVRSGDNFIGVYDPAAKRAYSLGASGSPLAYLPTGHLVFEQAGRLVAAPFDLVRTELAKSASSILPEATPGLVAFSGTGLVAYLHYPLGIRRNLVMVDRTGAHTPLVREAAAYRWPRLSPDGRRIAVGRQRMSVSDRVQISVIDLRTGSLVQLQDDGTNTEPVWTPDGRRLIYSSTRGFPADADLYWQPADGSGTSELLSSLPFEQWPTAVSPNGRMLAFYGHGQPRERQFGGIWTVTLDEAHKTTQILSSQAYVRGARFSPDGKWLAYSSDETGRSEIYVRPFPSLDAKWSISTEGGTSPVWSPDGRELFYRSGSRMMVTEVTPAPIFSARPPRVLFEGPFDVDLSGDIDYDIHPDGQHFVMMLAEPGAQARLRVLTHWAPEATKR